MRSFMVATLAAVGMYAMPALVPAASAQSLYNQCVNKCFGDYQCVRDCGTSHRNRRSKTTYLPPDKPTEPEKPVAKWIEQALSPPGGGGGGGGGGGR